MRHAFSTLVFSIGFFVLMFTAIPSQTESVEQPSRTVPTPKNKTYLPAISKDAPEDTHSIYWGAYVSNAPWNMADLDTFEALVGKPVSILHFGLPWKHKNAFKSFPTAVMTEIRKRGSIPMIGWGSWELGKGIVQPEFRLRLIADGHYDGYVTAWAEQAKAWDHPFFLKFNWEMDGNWQFPWSVQLNGNQIEDYVAAWRHVHDIFTTVGATNATWVWCPNTVSRRSISMELLYPGDSYVDWTCLHGYNFGDNDWRMFNEVFRGHPGNPFDSYQQILDIAPSKPIMLGEWASAEAGDGGVRKAAWIQDALEVQLPQHYPQIRAVVWFNWNAENGRTWTVDSSPAATSAFSKAIGLPFYLGNDFEELHLSPILPFSP